MSLSSAFISAAILAGAQSVLGQAITGTFPATPLASQRFDYPSGIPQQVDTEQGLARGVQFGFNRCNSTTENQESNCQTGFVNSLDDFCLWSAPKPNSVVGDTEGESVAWCTKPGRGTRLIPNGALQGVQFMRTPDYVQVVGFVDQQQIDLDPKDFGGELDPHGADFRGNPLGGLVYSNAWSGNNDTYQQVIEWHNFMGGNAFCFKVCDPKGPNAAKFCEHIYDRIGCLYNAPNAAKNGTFESCQGENQDFPGVYVDAGGATQTFKQPPEGVEPSPPYTPRIPASSNCVQFQSTALYTALATVTPTVGPFAPGASATAAPSGSGSGAASGSKSGASSSPTGSTSSNAGSAIAVGTLSTVLGVVFSVLFMA
ncbi:hypothetical protein DL96DRAFT_374042 [Flagelloscypha sp. PMI_526]|nr:hypothetical protein DL96DRAFT_374042 [Flagelloscypha sp. PMI_526]